ATINDGGTPDDPTDDTIDFTPDPNFDGNPTINYTITDSDGDSSPATVDITVDNVPTAVNDTATVAETGTTNIDILSNDNFGGDGAGTITIDGVTGGTATINDGGTPDDPTDDTIEFTPDPESDEEPSINYTITDSDGDSSSATVAITVEAEPTPTPAPNQEPIAAQDNGTTFINQPVTFNITGNDNDVDGNIDPTKVDLNPNTPGIQKTFTVSEGTFTVNDEGDVTFTPVDGFVGEVTIPYTVADNDGQTSNQANITVEVVNIPPVATEDSASSEVGVPVTFNIVNNDTDNDGNIDPISIDLDPDTPGIQETFTVPTQGTFTVNNEGDVTFTPVDGFVGEVNIPYTVDDNNGSTSEIANINVNITTELPFATDDNASTTLNTPVSFQLTENDIADEGTQIDPGTIDLNPNTPEVEEKTVTVDEGTFTVDDETGELTFTPTDGFVGEVTIPYTVKDTTENISNQGQITVEVIDNPPIATEDNATTSVNQPITFNIGNNDVDIEGEVVPSTIDLNPSTPDIEKTLTVPNQGIFNVDENGDLTFTPETNFVGEVTIPYTIADENNNVSTPANITVTVTPVGELTDDTASTPAN
ncbi:Ig-like domain-containing protein, partial [Dapis sp. BLCC M172]|uniref:Ig-like domain-containing protein n=1 Tax=Dapis sp. BLCC M172 TaxID=2975281 RepID=UPI003CFB3D9B